MNLILTEVKPARPGCGLTGCATFVAPAVRLTALNEG
ncbi:hypothetical protein J2Z31_000494 [Sinorhizobium kostiense]|uniref:Uncharacterized protein n=1 Tax=Sinorhizobium kostiense TaxID=76747 RepID=A0ABS4QU52_9HYPH|nr:hypothetical protein [Sinorhizobium kostiense]